MFGKQKRTAKQPPAASGPEGDPWDQVTLDWLSHTRMLDLRITSVERRFKSGPLAPSRPSEYMPEFVVAGFLAHAPQHVHFEMEFRSGGQDFGSGRLAYFLDVEHTSGRLNVPYLTIQLTDADGAIRNGIVEAMRDTISMGRSEADARVWPIMRDGWDETPGGHSRAFDIAGMIVWATLRSPRLSTWALPIAEADMRTHPHDWQLRSKPTD